MALDTLHTLTKSALEVGRETHAVHRHCRGLLVLVGMWSLRLLKVPIVFEMGGTDQ